MARRYSFATLTARVCIAHSIGLLATGLCGSIGTTAGVGSGVGVAMFIGGIVSLPWFAALLLVIWFRGEWLSRHMLALCTVGPVIVCGSYFVLAGAFIDAVAISSVTSSAVLLLATAGDILRQRACMGGRSPS